MVEADFFEDLYSNSVLKYVTLCFFFIGVVFGLTFELGIIWYEKSGYHRYRTVINQLFAFVSWIVIAYIIMVFIPDGVRYIAGPLNPTFCDIHNVLKNWICSSLLLAFDCIIILRYTFIFKVTNFTVINDDFVSSFLRISIVVSGLWVSFVNRLSIGKMSLNYFLCSGNDPEMEISDSGPKLKNGTHEILRNTEETTDDLPKKLDTTSMIGLASLVIHIVMFTKIFLYQRKVEKETENIQLGKMEPIVNLAETNKVGRGLNANNGKSMADFFTLTLTVMFLSVYSGILVTMHHYLHPAQLNLYEYRWIVYWNQILGVSVTIAGIAGSYYLRNSSLPGSIWRNVKTCFYCCVPSR